MSHFLHWPVPAYRLPAMGRTPRGLLMMAANLLMVVAVTHAARLDDLPVETATYLGGAGDDAAGGAGVAGDGTLLFGGTLPAHTPGGAPSTDLLGGGDGAVVRLSADGRQVIEVARLGSSILDLEVVGDHRVAVAAEGLGLVLIEAGLDAAAWHDPLDDPARVATGGTAAAPRVAVLTASKTVRVFDGDGGFLGERTFGDSEVADVAVSPDGGRVVVTGFNNRSTGGTPVQVPFLRAYDPTLAVELWRAYDWSAGQLVSEQDGSLADSRGVRVAFGEDGLLYFAGRTDGGNNTFRYDPLIVDRPLPADELISHDIYSNTAGISGAFSITVFGRFDPSDGDVVKLQYLLARLSSGNGNSVAPSAITADASGRVFLGGQAFARIQDRDEQKIAGQDVGPYQGGEAFLLAIDADFTQRDVWTVFTDAGGSQGSTTTALGLRGDRVVWAASLGNDTALMLRHQALQPARDAGRSAYFATRLWSLFDDGFESGDTDAWSSSQL